MLQAQLKQTRRGSPEYALLRAVQLQCDGDVKSAVGVLSAARSAASPLDQIVIDEVLAPLLISRGEYDRVAGLLDVEAPLPRLVPGRLALAAVHAAGVRQNETARRLRQEARELLSDDVGLLLSASTLQRCGLSAYYGGDHSEAEDSALESARIFNSIKAYRAAAGVYSLLYALSYSVANDFDFADEHARSWEAAARRGGNAAYEHAAIVAQYELAAERADEARTTQLRAKLRTRPLPPQFRERFSQILADTLPYGWAGDFRAVKANVVVAQTAHSLATTELAMTYALRSIAEAACGESTEARKHARRAVAMTAHLSRRQMSPYELRYLSQSRALSAAACVFVGDTIRGRRLLEPKFMGGRLIEDITAILEGGDWRVCDSAFRGASRLVSEARKAIARDEVSSLGLTPAELTVLRLLDDGLSAPQIARETGRSVHTVRVHTKSIISKFGVSGRNAALSFARRHGLLIGSQRRD
jgi:DNA-binding CsgD family transcriptional regulator